MAYFKAICYNRRDQIPLCKALNVPFDGLIGRVGTLEDCLKKFAIIGGIVLLVLGIGLPILLISQGWLNEARDLAIILLAIFQLFSVTLMIVLVGVLVVMVNELRNLAKEKISPKVDDVLERVKDITENAKVTTTTAKQTASYVAEGVVSPVIKAASLLAGVKAGAKSLARRQARGSLPSDRNENN